MYYNLMYSQIYFSFIFSEFLINKLISNIIFAISIIIKVKMIRKIFIVGIINLLVWELKDMMLIEKDKYNHPVYIL